MAPRNRPRRTVSEPPDLSTLGLSAERKQTPQVGEKPGNMMRLKEGSLGGGLCASRAGVQGAASAWRSCPERRPDRVVLPPGAFCGCLRRPAAALLACFLFWPTLIEPVSSQPPPIPDWSGPFAANRRLSGIKILPEVGPGSESIAATRHGWLYTGLQDGRVGPEPRIGAKARSGGERSIHTLSMRSSLARTTIGQYG